MLNLVILAFLLKFLAVNTDEITFEIKEGSNEIPQCLRKEKLSFKENDVVSIYIQRGSYDVQKVSCFLQGKDGVLSNVTLITMADFTERSRSSKCELKNLTVTKSMDGKWNCTFQVKKNESQSQTKHEIADCHFIMNVTSLSTESTLSKGTDEQPTTTTTIIISVAGFLVGFVIVAQTMAVCYFKAKAKSVAASRLDSSLALQTRGRHQHEERVYSTLPTQKNKRIKELQEEENRSTSGIYEDVVPDGTAGKSIKDRPPMPIPVEYEDPERLFRGKNKTAFTPSTSHLTIPQPPGLDTLPRKAKAKAKNMMEIPPRRDSPKPPRRPPKSPLVQAKPVAAPHPKVKDIVKNPVTAGASPPIFNELNSVLRKKREGGFNNKPIIPSPSPVRTQKTVPVTQLPPKPKAKPCASKKPNAQPETKPPPLPPLKFKPPELQQVEMYNKINPNKIEYSSSSDEAGGSDEEWTYEALSNINMYSV